MKRGTKILIAVFLGALLLFGGGVGWYLFNMGRETALMRPDASGEVMPGVFAANQGYVNSWFVKGADGWVAVDTGAKASDLVSEMRRMGIDPAAVKGVLLTHSDYDHAGGAAALAGVPLYMLDSEEQMVNGTTARVGFIRNQALPAHRLLTDGGRLTLAGLEIAVFHIPGHTPGSAAYLIGDGLLFVGDEMSIKDGRMAPFNAFFNMDSEQALKSHAKLKAIPGVKAVFTAHYGHSADPARLFSGNP